MKGHEESDRLWWKVSCHGCTDRGRMFLTPFEVLCLLKGACCGRCKSDLAFAQA